MEKNKIKRNCYKIEGYIDTFVLFRQISNEAYNYYLSEYQYKVRKKNRIELTKAKSGNRKYFDLINKNLEIALVRQKVENTGVFYYVYVLDYKEF